MKFLVDSSWQHRMMILYDAFMEPGINYVWRREVSVAQRFFVPDGVTLLVLDAVAPGGNGGGGFIGVGVGAGGGGGGAGMHIWQHAILVQPGTEMVFSNGIVADEPFVWANQPSYLKINYTALSGDNVVLTLRAGFAGGEAGSANVGGRGGMNGFGDLGGLGGQDAGPVFPQPGIYTRDLNDAGIIACASGDGGNSNLALAYNEMVSSYIVGQLSGGANAGNIPAQSTFCNWPYGTTHYNSRGGRGGASIFGPGASLDVNGSTPINARTISGGPYIGDEYADFPAPGAGGRGGTGITGYDTPHPGGPAGVRIWFKI